MNGMLVATLQVSAILLVALGLVKLLHRYPASLRHAVLMIAMACAALVPVLAARMPPWASQAILMPAVFAAPQSLSSPDHLQSGPRNSGEPGPTPPASNAALPASDAPAAEARTATAAGSRSLPPDTPVWPANLPQLLGAIYVAGVFISVATLLIGLLRLRRLAACAEPMQSRTWQRRSAAIAHAYGLRRTIRLARSPHPVLATWGMARPQVLLPAGAEDWPDDRIRAVLLHELAHIRRHDWLVQVLACAFRAIYWFNPLLWMACARLRQESEQACDDAAVEQGEDATEYATQLLALARMLTPPRMVLAPAPSMARRSTLRKRVTGLLDPATTHGRASRASLLKVAAAMLLITGIVAACEVAEQPRPAAGTPGKALTPALVPPSVSIEAAQPPVEVAPEVLAVADTPPPAAPPADIPAPEPPAVDAPASPQMVAAGIVDFTGSTLAADDPDQRVDDEPLRARIGAVQRAAQRVLDDNGSDPAGVPAKSIVLLNALGDAARVASNVAARPRTTWQGKASSEQLELALRAKVTQLNAVLLPLPPVTSIIVSTPARRAAVAALDLAQTALAEEMLARQRQHISLCSALDTLARAAQSVLNGNDDDQQLAATRLYALSTAIQLTERVAVSISGRPIEPEEARSKAARLAESLRGVLVQLDGTQSGKLVALPQRGQTARSGNPIRGLQWTTGAETP